MSKVAFYTLGCKLNFSETSALSREFQHRGYKKVEFQDDPDIFVINTCSVTDHADRKCKRIVREAKRISPDSIIAVVGCYAQLQASEIAQIPGVDLVLGAAEKFNLVNHVEDLDASGGVMVHCSDIDEVADFEPASSQSDRTRSFLKVQDGCSYKCTFCTIPQARGTSRSGSVESVVRQVEEILETGAKEIVLTGVNIGDFGIIGGKRKQSFLDLVDSLDRVDGDHRYRISSIEPNLLNDTVIDSVASSSRFVPHFHIPLQSGSDRILKSMARRYRRDLYQERIERISSLMPKTCIGVDVIVGFPGETESDFSQTLAFLKDLDISYLHVFPYSERPGTRAASMADTVPNGVRTKRSKLLRILSHKKRSHFYKQNLGSVRTALFEEESEGGMMQGFTDNYVRVQAPLEGNMINQLVPVQLEKIDPNGKVRVHHPTAKLVTG